MRSASSVYISKYEQILLHPKEKTIHTHTQQIETANDVFALATVAAVVTVSAAMTVKWHD